MKPQTGVGHRPKENAPEGPAARRGFLLYMKEEYEGTYYKRVQKALNSCCLISIISSQAAKEKLWNLQSPLTGRISIT